MSRGSIFDYDAIGKRLKEIRPEPYLKPEAPHVLPPSPQEGLMQCLCDGVYRAPSDCTCSADYC